MFYLERCLQGGKGLVTCSPWCLRGVTERYLLDDDDGTDIAQILRVGPLHQHRNEVRNCSTTLQWWTADNILAAADSMQTEQSGDCPWLVVGGVINVHRCVIGAITQDPHSVHVS